MKTDDKTKTLIVRLVQAREAITDHVATCRDCAFTGEDCHKADELRQYAAHANLDAMLGSAY